MNTTFRSSNLPSLVSCCADWHPWPKTLALIALATFITLLCGYRFLLNNSEQENSELKHTLAQQQQENLQLIQHQQQLQFDNQQQRQQLEQRDNTVLNQKMQLSMLHERIEYVEQAMGLHGPLQRPNKSIEDKLDTAVINSAVRSTMLRLIPSGDPIDSDHRSSGYGQRKHPVTGMTKQHLGLDLSANMGTPIYAPADGVIESTRLSRQGYGNLVRLQHAFGFMTVYAHLSKFNVEVGQFVHKGELIAWSGNSGLSTGPHLHYEIRFLGRALNPTPFIEWQADNFDRLFQHEKSIGWRNMVEVMADAMIIPSPLRQAPIEEPALAILDHAYPKHES
ncbi:M23 family metallopeptidase [Thaumasiovibrio sp. DFM-14]|uniref:M23 family metallopeptidase n=1 Tax=Thaumasiovibrio sp. DFM-14 TaxID=3384792 RepID=UPI0039A0E188